MGHNQVRLEHILELPLALVGPLGEPLVGRSLEHKLGQRACRIQGHRLGVVGEQRPLGERKGQRQRGRMALREHMVGHSHQQVEVVAVVVAAQVQIRIPPPQQRHQQLGLGWAQLAFLGLVGWLEPE